MDRNTTAALVLTVAVLGTWSFIGGNETLAESSVRDMPLLRAAYAGDIEAVKRLIASGANVNELDATGMSALHHATGLEAHNHHPEGRHVACTQALLKAGANANARTADGDLAPLYKAVYNPDLVEALLSAGADPNYATGHRTPLISAAYHGGELCTAATDSAKLLLKAGANIHSEEPGGVTALSTAAVYGCPGLVRVLLDSGARVDYTMKNGQSMIAWVKMAQQMHQNTLFGGSLKQVHADNLALLYEAASKQATRR
ncbi:MAG: ankyrin repeat domain-containing protein [Acidobacteriota bacterium]